MKIIEDGYVIGNIKDHMSESDYDYFNKVADYFPNIESHKNIVLTGQVSNLDLGVPGKSDNNEYTYDKAEELKQYLKDNQKFCGSSFYFVNIANMLEVNNGNWNDVRYFENFFKELTVTLLNDFYTEYKFNNNDIDSSGYFTYYQDGDFIQSHTDSVSPGRISVVLLYLNREWKEGDGGELVLSGKEKVSPTFGNFVILDYVENSLEHEVLKVNGDFKRYTYVHFTMLNPNSDNEYVKQILKNKI
jgi:Rps23 Pro-64 3,4-dihydroxylase Tpa1-like proline 4-hydroxylase